MGSRKKETGRRKTIPKLYVGIAESESIDSKVVKAYTRDACFRPGECVAVYEFAGWFESDVRTTFVKVEDRPEPNEEDF